MPRGRTAKATRIIFFIKFSVSSRPGMPGFDSWRRGLLRPNQNAASQHWSYAFRLGCFRGLHGEGSQTHYAPRFSPTMKGKTAPLTSLRGEVLGPTTLKS